MGCFLWGTILWWEVGLKGKWFLGIIAVLGCMIAIGLLALLYAVREPSRISATPTPTPCIPQESARITCTLSASETRVEVGDIVRLTMAISNPTGSCVRIGWFTYGLTQSPLLFTAEYYGFSEYDLDEQLVRRDAPASSRETFDVKAIQAGHGVVTGSIDFEAMTINTGIFAWSRCDAGEVDILVEP